MLRRQRETLIVTLATLAATILLYIVMPKGFLPLQDTGLITAVTEAGTDVSFAEMQRRQHAGRSRRSAPMPDVTGVVSVIGVSPLNATPNAGRLAITLKPRDAAQRARRRDHRAAERRGRRHSRHDGVFPGHAGHPDLHARRAARSTSTRWSAPMPPRCSNGPTSWRAGCAAIRRCARSPPKRRKAARACNVDVDREQAGRLGVSMQSITDTLNDAFGQRQISTIYGQANQYRVILEAQPRYQQDPGSLAKLYVTGASTSTGTAATVANTATGTTNTNTTATPNTVTGTQPGAARRLRALREHLGAAGDRAPGAIPLGHHQLRSGARLRAERRGHASSARRSRRSACRRR